jgi:lantibiotic modifying enzyme
VLSCPFTPRTIYDQLVDLAASLGDDLIEMAETARGGYSWPTGGAGRRRNLTGFSHGAAGVGHALLELFQVTGASKYQDAARQAFDYERRWVRFARRQLAGLSGIAERSARCCGRGICQCVVPWRPGDCAFAAPSVPTFKRREV